MKRIWSGQAGLTLIEVMLAIALIALVVGGVFGTQRGAMIIAQDVTRSQEAVMRQHSFVELMRRNLEQLPGNATLTLTIPRGSQEGSSEMFFKEYPLAFSWSGVTMAAKGVLLRIEPNGAGYFRAVVLYMDQERADDYENGRFDETAVDRATGLPAVRKLLLMDGIRILLWSFFDDQEQQWVTDWPKEKNRRPGLVKMEFEAADSTEPLALMFWIPVMASPQQFAGGGAPDPGGPAGGGPTPGGPGGGGPRPGGPGGGGPRPGGGPGQGGVPPGGGNPTIQVPPSR